MKPMN